LIITLVMLVMLVMLPVIASTFRSVRPEVDDGADVCSAGGEDAEGLNPGVGV